MSELDGRPASGSEKRRRLPARLKPPLSLRVGSRRLRYAGRLRMVAEVSGDGPLAGEEVLFEALSDEGPPQVVARGTLDQEGRCAVRIRARKRNWLRAHFPGSERQPEAMSEPIEVEVLPLLQARLSATALELGSSAVVEGSLRPAKSQVTLELQRRFREGGWISISAASVRLDGGRFRVVLRPSESGLYRLRARFLGDRENDPADSAWLSLRVTDQTAA